MSFLSRFKEFLIGSPHGVFRLPPGMTPIELVELGLKELAESHVVVGCSPDEICEIEEAFSVRLPRAYRFFLEKAGRNAGPFWRGEDYSYPRLMEFRHYAEELLTENNEPFRLQPGDFVCLMHQGYQFAFFATATGHDDPPVYYYQEGHGKPKLIDNTVTGWLLWQLQHADDGPPRHKKWLAD